MSDTTLDQQFVEYIVMSIVSNPQAVSVVRSVDDKGVLLELTVAPEDLGRVIGKHGGTAQSIRTLLRALGTKNEERFNLKIVDNGAPRPERSRDDQITSRSESTARPEEAERASDEPVESEMASKTRAELSDLDDLDI
jgi:uncharacterized protein